MDSSFLASNSTVNNVHPAELVAHIKALGIFDEFRRECLADVDTKPAYHNLNQRVDGYSSKFLSELQWTQEINKNNIRDGLRKYINGNPVVISSLDHLVDQVVIPKALNRFLPRIEAEVKKYIEAMELIKAPTVASSEGDSSSNEATSTISNNVPPPSPLVSNASVASPPNSDSPHSLVIVEDAASQDSRADSEVGNQVAITLTSLANTVSLAPVLESEDSVDNTPSSIESQEQQETPEEIVKEESTVVEETTVEPEPPTISLEDYEAIRNTGECSYAANNSTSGQHEAEAPRHPGQFEVRLPQSNNGPQSRFKVNLNASPPERELEDFLPESSSMESEEKPAPIEVKPVLEEPALVEVKPAPVEEEPELAEVKPAPEEEEPVLVEVKPEPVEPELVEIKPEPVEPEPLEVNPAPHNSKKIKPSSDPSLEFRRKEVTDKIDLIFHWEPKPENYSTDDESDTEFLEKVLSLVDKPEHAPADKKANKLSESKPQNKKRPHSSYEDQDEPKLPSKKRKYN